MAVSCHPDVCEAGDSEVTVTQDSGKCHKDCWWADISLGVSDERCHFCLLQRHCEPMWQAQSVTKLLFEGCYFGWFIWSKHSSPVCPWGQSFWWGHLASQPPKPRHMECPQKVQIRNLSWPKFLTWSRCSQDVPLWPSKPLNTVRMMSSFTPRINGPVFKLLCQG